MDDSLCLLCGKTNWRPLRSLTEQCRPPFAGQIVQCRGCGLARFSPLPSEAELFRFYSGASYLQSFAEAGVSMVSEELQTRTYLQTRLAYLADQLGRPGRILDVGASTGTFLALARECGWAIEGIELGDTGVERARQSYDILLHHCALETAPFPNASFDVIHASHVLEHVRQPDLFLQHVHRLLKPGGIFYGEVPSELGDLFTWFQSTFLRRLPKPYQVPSPHLYFFTPRTLAQLTARSGLVVKRLETPRRNKSLDSRIPGGALMKSLLYRLEAGLKQGPLIEIDARKPLDRSALKSRASR